ncbi:MAG TPA: DNRLRE domain-containing protein, partial [Tepidisphaeraceae bacterium]|nr:DNRLRE domain-containing protein [Tepidisphaeraceae bacterium]
QGTNTISKYTATGRLSNVGIENIGGISQYDPTVTDPTDGPVDENHPWIFINVDGAINSWVRNVTSQFFGYACVDVTNSKFVTVQDSQCLDPISQITGGRRYSFTIDGSQDTLVRNCYTREGRHDYVEGSTVTGPNVFVDDRADAEHADAGPHHRYSTAALWDNLTVGQLDIQNRGNSGTGHGWAGANQVIWNSKANSFIVQNPPAAQNWLIGSVGAIANGTMYVGPHDPGIYDSSGSSGVNVAQRSLYYQQLSERTAYENFALRESRLGDNDGFVTGDAADAVPVDATWKSSIQTATGKTGVEFDAASDGQLVPFTFNFNLDPNTYIVGASLSLGLKSTGGGTSGDAIYIEDKSRQYTWAQLGVAAPTTTEAGVVIDLSKLIPALQDGRLNLAILGNTTLDWATLNFQTASTTQPTATTLTASEDATVQDGSSANSNFANATTLQTKLDTVNNDQEAFLKWDLSSLSASGFITRATIRLVPTTVGYAPDTFNSGKGAIFNQLSFVSDDTWTEGGITWNNKPAAGAMVAEFISKANAPINVDVTALVRAALAGDRKLSLKLLSIVQDSAGQISYASSENGTASLRPQLIISTYGSALTPVADAYVRDGSSANTNFGSATDLETKKDSAANSGNNRDGYLKFDLTSIATAPAGATVRLMPIQVGAQLPETADFVTTDSWTESGITWNNKPANTTALGSFNVWQATPVKFSVGPQVASTIAGDKLLSVHLGTATANSGVNFFASREYADGSTVPLLILKNLGPQITSIQNQSGGVNQLVSSEWFGIWDAETAAGSLAVSAISSNTTLLPNANITFSGTTGDRFFTLTPASGQTGSTNVTITVTDAQGQTATSVFSYIVSSTLAINGDQDSAGENDVFRVVRNGTFVDIYRNNTVTPAFHMDYASAPQLLINTLGGNDIVTVDYSGGNPVPAAGIIVDGGTGNDTVAASGGAGADAVTLATGTVSVNGGQFSYANSEELDLGAGTGGDTIAATGNASVSTSLFTVTVTGGTLSMAASSTLPDFTYMVVSSGATFSLNGQNETVDALTGTGTVNDNNATAATLSVGQGGSSFAFAGVLANGGTGTFSLAKVGAGSFTLSGANTYMGTTTITAGEIASGISASFAGLA